MSKQGSVNIDSPPPSRYPMMRGGPMGAHNSNAPLQTYGAHFGGGNRPMGPRAMSMEQSGHIIGQKRDRDSIGFGGGNMFPGSPGQGSVNQDSGDAGNFAKLFVGSVPRTVTEDDIRPLFAEHGNVLEVALIKDKRTGQQQEIRPGGAASCIAWSCQVRGVSIPPKVARDLHPTLSLACHLGGASCTWNGTLMDHRRQTCQ